MITLSPQIVITLIIHLRNVTIPALVGYPQIALAEIQKNLYRINDDPTFDHLEYVYKQLHSYTSSLLSDMGLHAFTVFAQLVRAYTRCVANLLIAQATANQRATLARANTVQVVIACTRARRGRLSHRPNR